LLQFQIEDRLQFRITHSPSYRVKIYFGTRQAPLWEQTYVQPGTYTVTVQAPTERMQTMLTLEMVDEFGHAFFDYSPPVSFNMNFYRILKVREIG
jgi:hypothetical protein